MTGSPRQLSSLRQARIHPHDESTPQKGISVQLGSRSFKNHLSNCGIVATGQIVNAHAMGRLTMTVSGASRDVKSKELQNADLQFGALSY